MSKVVRIGCFSAFWGDTSTGAFQLVKQGGHLDYLVGDYLSEVTMGILARMKEQKPTGGFVGEFVSSVWRPLMKEIMDKKICVITNAGGMNPVECKAAIEAITKKAGLPVPVVAAISGDDVLPNLKQLQSTNALLPFEVESEKEDTSFLSLKKVMSANAYFGAEPIVRALEAGAQVIVTGRCSDSALVLAPLMHEFKWKSTDYDLLASGSVAGHIIECGCQATGGNFTDWEESYGTAGWDNVGFPIVEASADGSFVVTKPENTGGVVNRGSVAEQLVYEIGDPKNYILPDVVVDFTGVTLTELPPLKEGGAGRVLVKGARGTAPTPHYKVSITYFDGFKMATELVIAGFNAALKARAVADGIIGKVRKMLAVRKMKDFDAVNVEVIGAEHMYGPHSRAQNAREVILRISVKHSTPEALEIFAKEISPAATGMAPAITGSGDGRPRPTPLLSHAACLVRKDKTPISIHVGSNQAITYSLTEPASQPTIRVASTVPSVTAADPVSKSGVYAYVPIIELCYARSGDKGDIANIGIIARRNEYYPFLKQVLTSEAVHCYLKHLVGGKVTRYELPGISALNFVCTKSLGGGGLSSLNIDRQGKCYGQILLDYQVKVPVEWIRNNIKSKL